MNSNYSFLARERVASIREIQKSPSSALRGFTRVLRGTKTLGFFFPKDEFDTLLEDIEALTSKELHTRVRKARNRSEERAIPEESIAEYEHSRSIAASLKKAMNEYRQGRSSAQL